MQVVTVSATAAHSDAATRQLLQAFYIFVFNPLFFFWALSLKHFLHYKTNTHIGNGGAGSGAMLAQLGLQAAPNGPSNRNSRDCNVHIVTETLDQAVAHTVDELLM